MRKICVIGRALLPFAAFCLPLLLMAAAPVWYSVNGVMTNLPSIQTGTSKTISTLASDGTTGVLLGPFTAGQAAIWFRKAPSAATTSNYSIGTFDSGDTLALHGNAGGFIFRGSSDTTIASINNSGTYTAGAALTNQVVIAGSATTPSITTTGSGTDVNLDIDPKGAGVVTLAGGVEVTGCTNCDAVYGTASGNGNGGDFSSSGSGNAVQATASGTGPGIRTSGNATNAPLILVPQASEPSTCSNGAMYYNSATDTLRYCKAGVWTSL